MKIQVVCLNHEHATTLRLRDGSGIHYFGSLPAAEITSFMACLDLSLWRKHYQPFAVICESPNTDDVVLVRDHFGVEPLYYCNHLGKKLILGQTIPEVLKQLPSTPPLLESRSSPISAVNSH